MLYLCSSRMDNRLGSATSDTTYHSFNDIELFEPASPPRRKTSTSSGESEPSPSSRQEREQDQSSVTHRHSSQDDHSPTAYQMKRQDSGYASYTSTPRASMSQSRPVQPRRTSTSNVQGHFSSSSSTTSKSKPRQSTRRSIRCHNRHQPPSTTTAPTSPYLVRSPASQPASAAAAMDMAHLSSSYFQFPSPDPAERHDADIMAGRLHAHDNSTPIAADDVHLVPPPQTTHYWTSDRTRRLEYAAIDAASRGVKGWIRRNLLPDCFVPQDDRHVAFDDDTGSVRRYRLELEDEVPSSPALSCAPREKTAASSVPLLRRKTWQFWNGSSTGSRGKGYRG